MTGWHYVEVGKVRGPLTAEEMRAAAQAGMLPPETPVWREGLYAWTALAATAEYLGYFTTEQRDAARAHAHGDLPPLPRPAIPNLPPPPRPLATPIRVDHPPYPLVPPDVRPMEMYRPPRSKVAAGLFGILLGPFGIHRFYLGYTGVGVAMLLLTVCSGFVLSPLTFLWGLVEGILCLNGSFLDSDGRPLTG